MSGMIIWSLKIGYVRETKFNLCSKNDHKLKFERLKCQNEIQLTFEFNLKLSMFLVEMIHITNIQSQILSIY